MKNAKIIGFLVAFFLCSGPLFSAAKQLPLEGYNLFTFKAQVIAANATWTYQLPQPVSCLSFWQDKTASFTFQNTVGTGFNTASSTNWIGFVGSKTVELMPVELASGSWIWFKNGSGAQTYRFMLFGQ